MGEFVEREGDVTEMYNKSPAKSNCSGNKHLPRTTGDLRVRTSYQPQRIITHDVLKALSYC